MTVSVQTAEKTKTWKFSAGSWQNPAHRLYRSPQKLHCGLLKLNACFVSKAARFPSMMSGLRPAPWSMAPTCSHSIHISTRSMVSCGSEVPAALRILRLWSTIFLPEYSGTAKHITAFVDKQRDICKAFGYEIPRSCDVGHEIRKVESKKKRGRPRKPRLEN